MSFLLSRIAVRQPQLASSSSSSRLAVARPGMAIASAFSAPRRNFTAIFPQHRDTPDNNPETPFEWTEDSKAQIAEVLKRYPPEYKRSATIPLLWIAQEQNENFLTLSAMNKVAEELDIPPIRVYETATFYTQFNRVKRGKHHIQLCGTTSCRIVGAMEIKDFIQDYLGIQDGETTKDGMFTMTEVECLGACVNAPMCQINNKFYYEHLNPERMKNIIDTLKRGEQPKPYNQNHIRNCEGPMGKTTLKTKLDHFANFRDLDKLKAEHEAAKKAAAAEE